MLTSSWLDIIIICIIGLSILTGLLRGFIKESIALLAWVVALWLAFNYSPMLAVHFQHYVHDVTMRTIIAFLIIVICTILIGAIVSTCCNMLMRKSGLKPMDRILGMVFGVLRGVFIIILLGVVLKITGISMDKYTSNSRLYPSLEPLIIWLYDFTPQLTQHASK